MSLWVVAEFHVTTGQGRVPRLKGAQMASERDVRRRACVDKATAEIDALTARGVRMGGNAFSAVLLVKGELTDAEKDGGTPFSGADGTALRVSLERLGYAPEDWEWLLSVGAAGESLDAALFREAVCALDPATLVCLEEAMLAPGVVARICGMRVLNLGGFAAALADAHEKQVMWARLKKIPPLGEPY